MLFSNDQVAYFINKCFEPVWQSLRPVPILTLDFGNGQTLTRTLHGNVVTSICNADGKMLDALPGLYDADSYLKQINQLCLLHVWLDKKPAAERDAAWKDYHRIQADALQRNIPTGIFTATSTDFSKARVERTAKSVIINFTPPTETAKPAPTTTTTNAPKADRGKAEIERPAKSLLTNNSSSQPQAATRHNEDVAHWPELLADTKLNETQRRLQIHQKLAQGSPPNPESISRWLYANVLHADLDDPYLGLKPLLQGDYPFKDAAGH